MDVGDIIGTLGGVVLGSVLTQASTWLGTRQANQRVGKEVLFFLLQLHQLLAALERWERLNPQFVALLRRYTTPPHPDIEASINERLQNLLHDMAVPLIGLKLTALKAGYDMGLLKLATIDPVSAYRLHGLDELLQKVPQVLGAVQTAGTAHLGEPLLMPSSMAAFFREHVEAEDVKEALALVGSIMHELAGQLDRPTQRKLAEQLALEHKNEKHALSKVNNFMEKMQTVFQTQV